MNFHNLKKIISIICLLSILLSGSLLVYPKKAEATGIPVIDISNLWQNIMQVLKQIVQYGTQVLQYTEDLLQSWFQEAEWFKEYILDPAAWIITKEYISDSTADIIGWIGGGFGGNPMFIEDMGQFLENAGVEAKIIFLDELAVADLCLPFKTKIQISLNMPSPQFTTPAGTGRIDCTLDNILSGIGYGNINDFYDDFHVGGWRGWLVMTTVQKNNPYGAYLLASNELDERKAKAEENAKTEALMSDGFKSVKTCVGGFSSSGACLQWSIDTPGKVIEDYLAQTIGSEIRQLEMADEWSEILFIAVGNILSNLQSGL